MPNDSVPYIRFACPCGGSLTIRSDEAQKIASCPFCGKRLLLKDLKRIPRNSESQISHGSQSGSRYHTDPTRPLYQPTMEKSLSETSNLRHESELPSLQPLPSEAQTPRRSSVSESQVIPEWSPDKVVKPTARTKTKVAYQSPKRQGKGSTPFDLWMTVGLLSFAFLFLSGIGFWWFISSNGDAGSGADAAVVVEQPIDEESDIAQLNNDNRMDEVVEEAGPELKSPCIEFHGIECSVAQALADNGEVAGDKLFIDVGMKNLTNVSIEKIRFELIFRDANFQRTTEVIDRPIRNGLSSLETVELQLVSDNKDWQSLEIWAVRFTAEGQVNKDRVGPLTVKN